jgi:adenylate cyclase
MVEIIGRYRGRVVDSPGDNLLAEFATAVDSVECAFEIQTEMKAENAELPENRRMQFRIGINLGDVIGEGERIYGDGVNIAARIEGMSEGGGICLSGTVYDQVESKLKFQYEYMGEQTVKNISKPVRVYRLRIEPQAPDPLVVEAKRSRGAQRKWIALVVGAALVVGGASVIWGLYFSPAPPEEEVASVEEMAFPLPDKPSIAVLSFENLSGDPGQDYLGDGISENIIAALSNISELFVIARNSTFAYKDRPVKIQQVAEELGVRYVLEGSVQKADDRIRVTAQLVDAITGHHLWARRYDRDLKDLFATQDEITLKIVKALRVELTDGEQARMWHTSENFEAWSQFVRAGDFFQRFTKEDNANARELLERAVKLDPGYSSAWTTLAWTYLMDAWLGFNESPEESIKAAIELGKKSMMLDDTQPEVHSLWNTIYLVQRQWDKAVAEGKEAVRLGPSNAVSHALLAYALLFSGEFDEAISHAERSIRLTPYCPNFYLLILAQAYRQAGRYEKAYAIYQKAMDRSHKDEGNPLPLLYGLADVCVQLGREEEARSYAAELLRIEPNFFLEFLHTFYLYKNPAHLERILVNLRKAGLPERLPALPEQSIEALGKAGQK